MDGRSRFDRRDVLLAAGGFLATVGYLALCPPVLMTGDEANYLHEAKRVAGGEVLYRDVFELTTPGWVFLVAALFRVFGTDIATAKAAMWVVNGFTAAALFLTCRALGVRRLLSWPLSLLPVALAFPAWPFASQHWLASMLSVVLVLACLATPRASPAWRIVPGVVLGLMIATHQRGALIGTGVAIWLVVDRLLVTRGERTSSDLLAPVGWLVAGSLLVLVPMTVYLVASAGFEPVWRALVVHPLVYYRAAVLCPWGSPGLIAALFTFPTVLKYAPVVLVVPAVRLLRPLWLGMRRSPVATAPGSDAGVDATSPLLLSLLVGAAAIASIDYYPDSAHIAFIVPLLLVILGQNLEWGVRCLPRSRLLRGLGYVAVAALLVATAMRLQRNLRAWRGLFPLREDTAFGRIAVESPTVLEQEVYIRDLLRDAPERSLFGYPISASRFCLTADARNPTRYEFFSVGYNTPAQMQEVIGILSNQPPAYVILSDKLGTRDPLRPTLDRYYTVFFAAQGYGQFTILKRRTSASPSILPAGGLSSPPPDQRLR